MNGSRLAAVGIALILIGTAQAMDAVGFEYAVGDCIAAAAIATVLTAMAPTM